jgi:hypothetical protein
MHCGVEVTESSTNKEHHHKLSTVTKTFVVKDAERRDGGGRGMAKGGKVNSTCCRVHKNAELVPDSAGIRMYVRTTRQVRVDSEILVMYQPDRRFFGGVQGRCVLFVRESHTRVLRVGLWRAS